MSMAKLNVWITNLGDACHIDDKNQYYVHITDCHGNPLTWCKQPFTFLPAKCGHLEIEIPPGCYTVFASQSATPPPGDVKDFGNYITHVQVVRANCGDHVCVTLFAPGMKHCGTWFQKAMETQMEVLERNHIDPRLAKNAIEAIRAFLAQLPSEQYTERVVKMIEQGPPKG